MKTLTDRKLAEQERVTYETQKGAQAVRQELEQATALANTQANVVDAERQVSMTPALSRRCSNHLSYRPLAVTSNKPISVDA